MLFARLPCIHIVADTVHFHLTLPFVVTAGQTYPSSVSSNVLLSAGAPSFGGGGSFETLDFSLPSYSEAIGGSVGSAPKKDVSDLFQGLTGSSGSDEDADAKAAKEEAKRIAAEEKAGDNPQSFCYDVIVF